MVREIETIGVSAQVLSETPLIAYDEHLPLVRSFWLAAFRTQPVLQAAITVPDMRIVESLVCAGHGWSVLPSYLCYASLASGTLKQIPFSLPPPENTFYLTWDKAALRNPRVSFMREHINRLIEQGVFTLSC